MKVLFVCTANICRSALAEAILKKMLQESGVTGIEVESAGVRDLEGEPRDPAMASYAHEAGYELTGRAVFVTQELMDAADWIICMEHRHIVEIQKRLPYALWSRIHLFNEICFGEKTDVPDPSGDTDYMYVSVLKHIKAGCDNLIGKLSNVLPRHQEDVKQR